MRSLAYPHSVLAIQVRYSCSCILPELKDDSDEGDDGAEEFTGELDPGICSGHGDLGHGEGAFAEEIFIEAGAGHGHFDEAGGDGDDEIPPGKAAKGDEDEGDADDEVKEEPEGGVEGGGVVVNLGVDVIALKPGKDEKEACEEEVKEFHRN